MTMTKLRIKLIPAIINRIKGEAVAITPQQEHTGPRRRVTAERWGGKVLEVNRLLDAYEILNYTSV